MRPIAKSVKRQVRSKESSHIVNTTIRLSRNAVPRLVSQPQCLTEVEKIKDKFITSCCANL